MSFPNPHLARQYLALKMSFLARSHEFFSFLPDMWHPPRACSYLLHSNLCSQLLQLLPTAAGHLHFENLATLPHQDSTCGTTQSTLYLRALKTAAALRDPDTDAVLLRQTQTNRKCF